LRIGKRALQALTDLVRVHHATPSYTTPRSAGKHALALAWRGRVASASSTPPGLVLIAALIGLLGAAGSVVFQATIAAAARI
jgi:hypothetical protein